MEVIIDGLPNSKISADGKSELNGRLALPNSNWVRSPLLPIYALCLEAENYYFGWIMVEDEDDRWDSVRKLTIEEIDESLEKDDLAGHISQLKTLREQMTANVEIRG